MKLRLGAQLAAGFAVPIVALTLIVGAVMVVFSRLSALNAAHASQAQFDAAIGQLEVVMIAAGVATVVATIGIAVFMARRMTRRLARVSNALSAIVHEDFARLSNALGRLAEGDLRASFRSTRERIEDGGNDEIAALVESYNDLGAGLATVGTELTAGLGTLRELIGGVIVASRTLAIASDQTSSAANQASVAVEQIAKAVDSVAGGAKDQAIKIAQATAAIEELARSAEMIAEGAGHQATAIQLATGAIQLLDEGIESLTFHGADLATSASDATKEAVGGTHAVLQTQRAMQKLREISAKAAEAMLALEQRSVQVEDIVRTIEEIADQTNLLALNAAIEAARAGDHGRGFAVVADEVRKLAERSSGATREISGILSSIRRETITAAEAMRSSDESMNTGMSVAERASEALDRIGGAVGGTTGVAEELAARAREMKDASSKVAENVSSTSAGVEENAAAANQMQATTHEITATMMPVARAAEEQSAAAQQAAFATGELASGVGEIDATARALREQAERLDALVARFIVADEDAPDPGATALRVPDFGSSVASRG